MRKQDAISGALYRGSLFEGKKITERWAMVTSPVKENLLIPVA
jgi:hypothetical protein